MKKGIALTLALAFGLGVAAQAQQQLGPQNDAVHAAERARLGLGELRRGADGTPGRPNSANTDEAKVVSYALPPLWRGATPSRAQWDSHRTELARLVEENWTGRVPESAAALQVIWKKEKVATPPGALAAEHWNAQVIAPDGRSGPQIDATVVFPRRKGRAPAFIDYTYVWPAGFNMASLGGGSGGPRPPDSVETALRHGFAHVAYRPQMLQADNAAEMERGVIGLARWPREKTDWGALRAWGWGASKLREELARDPRINGGRISLAGHSRFGKGVLVAAAFDHAFADADVSSSGAGGAKLMRRNFGETWENLTASGEFHWFTPNAMAFSVEGKSVNDLPVDAHTLIALRAPRPLFVTSGTAEKGDSWVDPRGMWLAVRAAQPAWALYGLQGAAGEMPAPGAAPDAPFALGWFQHTEGHVPWPGYEQFYAHEAKFASHK